MPATFRFTRRRTAVVAAAALAFVLAGCRQDMHNQPKYKPLRQSDFFADGQTSRPIPENTVARGQLHEDKYLQTGMISGAQAGDAFPIPIDRDALLRGQERFNIYCAPCHSRLGDGDGMIVRRGYRRPPSYHDPRLRAAPAGHFFDVMTNGFGAMPSYAAQIPVVDRWKIVAYIRALQLSQNATADMVPADQRERLSQAPSQLEKPEEPKK